MTQPFSLNYAQTTQSWYSEIVKVKHPGTKNGITVPLRREAEIGAYHDWI